MAAWAVMGTLICACASNPPAAPPARPNFLVVVTDDLGYSDIGPFGSEIPTPNLDGLAESGLVASNFYVSPCGAPSVAMLLTGVDHHWAGFGSLEGPAPPGEERPPGYEGYLNQRVVTIASLLRDAGYHTIMAGKWEMGGEADQLPPARGFERSFALLDEIASYWSDMAVVAPDREKARFSQNGEPVGALPLGYYSTRFFTDFVMQSIDLASDRPFFAFLSYQAPHSPLSVPEDWLDRAAGRYDDGFGATSKRRLTSLKHRGLVRKEVVPYPGLPTIPGWDSIDEEKQRELARKMELYAVMVENLDFHLGRLLDHLREIGELEHTLVIFLSDNGASPANRGPAGIDPQLRGSIEQAFPDSGFENWGRPGSFVEVGAAWAQVSMVPFRLFRGTQAEGGVRSPLVMAGPGVRGGDRTTKAILHVTDLAPTLLELAGIDHPDSYRGRPVEPMGGRSLVRLLADRNRLNDEARRVRGGDDWLGFELNGNRALRRGPWKAMQMAPPLGTGAWRLYRLDRDPSELFDRAEEKPERLGPLVDLWGEYARLNNVLAGRPQPSDPFSCGSALAD